MAYIPPRVLINQEFTQVPVFQDQPLPAFIIGPQFALFRYDVAAEKQLTAVVNPDDADLVNDYQASTSVTYDFPNVPSGGNVDHSYTKVYLDLVQALYFPNADLGLPGAAVSLVTAPSSLPYTNRVRFADNVVLKTANGYDRSSCFSNRDVKVGDYIEVTDDLDNVVKAKITALHADTAEEDSDLDPVVAPVLENGTDGVTNGTTTFTSAGAEFTAAMVGKVLTVNTKGSYKIIAVNSATSLSISGTPSAATGLTYKVNGTYNDVGNVGIQTEDYNNAATYVWTGDGADPGVSAVTVANDSTAYKGYADKRILSDRLTGTVTTGGDLTAVRFTVTSQAGAFVDVEDLALQPISADADILVLDNDDTNNVRLDFTGSTAFEVGQSWYVDVTAPVAMVNPTAAGTYSGNSDIVYKLTVQRGGEFYDGSTNADTCARIVITSSGVDSSAAVLVEVSTAFQVGNYGVTASFGSASADAGLIEGDIYYIPATKEAKGAVRSVEFAADLSEASLTLASDFSAKLYLVQNDVEIAETRSLVDETVNWSQEDNEITVESGITTYDPLLIEDGGEEPARLDVKVGKVYVQHRDLLQDNVVAIASLRSTGDVEDALGTVHPDNPLAQGVYDAVLNSNNQPVYYLGVATNDLSGYNDAIDIAKNNDKVYGFVPLSYDRSIQDAIVGHVNAFSTAEVGLWRVAWLAIEDVKEAAVYDLDDEGNDYTATVTDDPVVTGTQYRLVTVAGATFIDDGIRANDKVRLNFRLGADGEVTYDEYVVDSVRTQTSLILTTSLEAAINVPVKVQVVQVYTKNERAETIGLVGGEYNNRRVRVVFPDVYEYVGVEKAGYFLAASLAGLRSGVVPHQGLTNTEVLGADDLSKVVLDFTQDQLNLMAEQGIWIVTQAVVGATPYVRHQLTTQEESLNTSEDSITTNVDSISYGLKAALAPYIGQYNINPENLLLIRDAIVAELTFRATSTRTVRAGNQLTSFTPKDDILVLKQNDTFKDRIDVEVRLNVPYPLNHINLTLVV